MALRQERELDLAGDLDLVAREKLVFQLEHENDEENEHRPGPDRDENMRAPDAEVRIEDGEEESDHEQDPARRSESQEEVLPQPEHPPHETGKTSHFSEPGLLLLAQVEPLEIADILPHGPREAGTLEILDQETKEAPLAGAICAPAVRARADHAGLHSRRGGAIR